MSASASASARVRTKPRVVLYNPRAVFYTMPLSLVAIGSHLDPKDFEVVIVDARLEADPVAALLDAAKGALCVGMSVLTGAPIADAVAAARAVKASYPELPVVWGGWHPSMFGRECLDEPSVDVTVQGQGELTFREIVERLAARETLQGVQGSTLRDGGGTVVVNPPRPLADVESFRSHDYELIDVERYFALKGERQLDYIASQGCRFRCAFCADPFVFGRSWVGLSPSRIAHEVETLARRYDIRDLSFQDETFFTRTGRVVAIAKAFLDRGLGITWAATMRADQCRRLPETELARCRASGLRRVLIGVESGSRETLASIKKDIVLEEVRLAAERCVKHGIAAIFPFIVGFPGEAESSVRASLDLAKELGAMSPDFETPIFFFKPYPGSELTLAAVRSGYRLPETLDEWARFDFIGSAGPWVSPALKRKVERFRFYQRFGTSSERRNVVFRAGQKLARWRLARDEYRLPLEKVVGEWIRPSKPLS